MTINNSSISGLLGILALAISSCSSTEDSPQEKVIPVEVTVAIPGTYNQEFASVNGTIQPINTAMIGTRFMGHVTRITVASGQKVKKGQVLIEISSNEVLAKRSQAEAMIAEASAALAVAERDLQRFSDLKERNSATTKELENASLQYSSAEARYKTAVEVRKEAEALLSYTYLRAPFDGIVTGKNVDIGSLANPGQTLLVVEENDRYQIKALVRENQVPRIKTGTSVDVFTSLSEQPLTGKIREINPSAQFNGGQYEITIDLELKDADAFYSGMYVNLRIPLSGKASEASVLVPRSAIVTRDQLSGIYSVSESDKAVLRWLRLGKTFGDHVEVLSGLSQSEKFVLHSEGRLYDGVPVVVREESALSK